MRKKAIVSVAALDGVQGDDLAMGFVQGDAAVLGLRPCARIPVVVLRHAPPIILEADGAFIAIYGGDAVIGVAAEGRPSASGQDSRQARHGNEHRKPALDTSIICHDRVLSMRVRLHSLAHHYTEQRTGRTSWNPLKRTS